MDAITNTVTIEVRRGATGAIERQVVRNLISTAGMELLHANIGGGAVSAQGSPATGMTDTSFTATGTPWTTDALKGRMVVFPVTGLTTAPVFANILSNTSSVAQVDGWWDATYGASTTPASTSGFIILPGTSGARYIGLSDSATTPSIADTALPSEITANGLGRALASYAHTAGNTFTLTKTWTATGAQSVRRAGLYTGGYGSGGGGVLVAQLLFTAASLVNTDTIQLVWTWTLPAAG